MIEYTVLTTFACILAFATLWVIRTVKTFGRKLYNAFLPSSKSKFKKPITDEDLPVLSAELKFLSTPWGWRDTPRRFDKVLPTLPVRTQSLPIPWGWPGGHAPEFKQAQGLRYFADRVSAKAKSVEVPFARNHNAVTIGPIPLLTYFDYEDDSLRFPITNQEKNHGFQVPWGW